jgi:signal transduction histidine kinase
LYWIGSFLDIHEQHISELKATQEREKFATDAKYRAFSNSIPQVVFEATENRGLIFVNEQWNLYTGQNLAEALDLGFAKHVHPDDLEKCGGISSQTTQSPNDTAPLDSSLENHGVSSALDELVRRGVASLQRDENGRVFYSTEIRLRSRGGDFRWHLVRLVCVETSSFGSEEASWYGTCTDINDRKNLERELNKAMSQLNNQMESKTKFFSNMSHEIRTPLNGILGTIPFILDTQLDSDQRRMLDTIQNSSTNLRELVDNILDVSRVEAGKMSMVNSWFHVRSMIEDVIDTIASRAQGSRDKLSNGSRRPCHDDW